VTEELLSSLDGWKLERQEVCHCCCRDSDDVTHCRVESCATAGQSVAVRNGGVRWVC